MRLPDLKDGREIAEGRIYSGRDGKQVGLVDEIGGLPRAVAGLLNGLRLGSDADQAGRADPTATLIRLMLEHQPRLLVLLPAGYYPAR